jgi:hypothetical protein
MLADEACQNKKAALWQRASKACQNVRLTREQLIEEGILQPDAG